MRLLKNPHKDQLEELHRRSTKGKLVARFRRVTKRRCIIQEAASAFSSKFFTDEGTRSIGHSRAQTEEKRKANFP